MKRDYFLATERIGFSQWQADDIHLAKELWGNPRVTRFICASGRFTEEEVINRLRTEIENQEKYQLQYWPFFSIENGKDVQDGEDNFIGCCGLRPYQERVFELGFHLRPEFWGQGYAVEAARTIIDYAFNSLGAHKLVAGHNPNNIASKKVLGKLGFTYIGDNFYEPTGLYHPSYELLPGDSKK